MEEKFIKAARILERLSEETFGPNDNWSIPGMQLHRAKNGNEDAKTSICLMVGASVGLSAKDVERVFDSLYGGTNENKQHKTNHNMKKTIRLSESDFHRVIRESVYHILKEQEDRPEEIGKMEDDNYYGGGLPDEYFTDERPSDNSISTSQIRELQDMMDALADIANNCDYNDYELLYQAADLIEKFLNVNDLH